MKITEEKMKDLEQQLACPSGESGIDLAKTMHQSNIGMTLSAIDFLAITDNDCVLELGHGNCGHLSQVLDAGNNIQYCGLEISETMFDLARKNSTGTSAVFTMYDGTNIPFADNAFHKIFSVNTIYFWENPQQLCKEIARVLAPRGICVLAYANKDFMESLPFVRDKFVLYDQTTIQQLLSQTNLEIIEIKELQEHVQSKTGEPVRRTYTLIKIKHGIADNV